MDLKFKKLSEKAVTPTRAHIGDAGLDLTCTRIEQAVNEARQILLVYHTDIAVEIPRGYAGLLFPRSSIYNKSISLANCVSVLDAGYRGEVMAVFRINTDGVPVLYNVGDRFLQLVIVPIPEVDVVEMDELSESDRGESGFGSTGDKEDVSAATGSQSRPDNEDESINSETATEQAADRDSGSEQV